MIAYFARNNYNRSIDCSLADFTPQVIFLFGFFWFFFNRLVTILIIVCVEQVVIELYHVKIQIFSPPRQTIIPKL